VVGVTYLKRKTISNTSVGITIKNLLNTTNAKSESDKPTSPGSVFLSFTIPGSVIMRLSIKQICIPPPEGIEDRQFLYKSVFGVLKAKAKKSWSHYTCCRNNEQNKISAFEMFIKSWKEIDDRDIDSALMMFQAKEE
jgi:hypothetical protein